MAEYIDREEYCEKHCRCSNEYCDKESCPIWKAPAADVVPVVRCKDCKHSYEDIGGRTCSHGVCVDCIVPDDFCCAYGKREENNNEAGN